MVVDYTYTVHTIQVKACGSSRGVYMKTAFLTALGITLSIIVVALTLVKTLV